MTVVTTKLTTGTDKLHRVVTMKKKRKMEHPGRAYNVENTSPWTASTSTRYLAIQVGACGLLFVIFPRSGRMSLQPGDYCGTDGRACAFTVLVLQPVDTESTVGSSRSKLRVTCL